MYIDLLEHDDLKNIIKEKSQIFNVNKKLKKEKKENVIISGKKAEISLTNSLYYLLNVKRKSDLFNML